MGIFKRRMPFFIKWSPGSNYLRTHQQRRRTSKQAHIFLEEKTAYFSPRSFGTWVRQAIERDYVAFELICCNKTNPWMALTHFDHAAQAFRKEPIIGLHNLAVFAFRRNQRESKIVV